MGFAYVLPRYLAQGSAPPDCADLSAFDVLVLTAQEYQNPTICHPVEVLRVKLDDSGRPPTDVEIRDAQVVAERVARRIKSGKRVLVTCYMGRNRSGLVSALTLVNLGYSAKQAIAKVRLARPQALSNGYFVDCVNNLSR